MYEEWIATLESSPLFDGIEGEALPIMLDCLKPKIRKYRQREIIAVYGRKFEGIGIIVGGSVALTRETVSGNRIVMGILEKGDIFGETVAFSDRRTWPATVLAHEDCTVLFLPPDSITGTCSNVCQSHTRLITNMLRILSNKALMLNRQLEHTSAKNIRGKISSYFLETHRDRKVPEFTLPLKRHELADYLGIPRPSLSREMAAMRDEGIITFKGSRITIKDALKLEESLT